MIAIPRPLGRLWSYRAYPSRSIIVSLLWCAAENASLTDAAADSHAHMCAQARLTYTRLEN